MVQVVHQDSYASLNPVRTVGQTLRAPLLYHGLSSRFEVDRKVLDLLGSVGLTPPDYFANKYPFQLSGGQRQHVSIARAMMLSPRLILTDEPFLSVDASLRLAILDLIRGIKSNHAASRFYTSRTISATARYFGKGGPVGRDVSGCDRRAG